MPNYIGYSPWMDAAQVGKGLGDTLGAILFKVPEMKRQHDLEQRRIDLEERRIKSDEDMSKIHGELYQAQTQNIPLQYALKKSLDDATMATNQKKVEIAQQEADSKKTLREKQMEELAQKIQYNPIMNQAHLNLMNANAYRAQVSGDWIPVQDETQRRNTELQFKMMGEPAQFGPLPERRPAPPSSTYPSLVPPQQHQQGSVVPNDVLQRATQFLNKQNRNPQDNGTIPTDSGPSLPSTHTYKVRNRYTGQMGYANENGLKDPDWEVVHE